ncbi:MAG: hypothetical protein QW478_15175, partial [Candidatus Micrarchaeaceae archaeon]
DTPNTRTSGIMEAINYVISSSDNSTYYPEIHLLAGEFLIHQPIYLSYTIPPPYIGGSNGASITAPSLIGTGGRNGQNNFTPLNTYIKCASDFPSGEYAIAFLLPPSAYFSGATNPQWVGGILKNFTLDNNNLGAGICLIQYGNGEVKNIAIRNPTVPNPTITLAPSTNANAQTGAFVYTSTDDSGEDTTIEDIQIRGGSYEDGFVLFSYGGINAFRRLWCASGAKRYGFYQGGSGLYPMLLEDCESDTTGGWTGAVPTGLSPGAPQSASYLLTGPVTLLNTGTFIGAPPNSPFIAQYANTTIINSYLRGSPNPVSGNPYVIVGSGGNSLTLINTVIEYNSSYYGVLNCTNSLNNEALQKFINVFYSDDNSGTPAVKPFNLNYGSDYTWTNVINIEPFFDSRGRYMGGYPPSLIANPPVSATIYQNQNISNIRIILPAYATTSGTAGSVAIAMGPNYSTLTSFATKFINGSTSSSATELIELVVPGGWYYEFTATGATLGTATVMPA